MKASFAADYNNLKIAKIMYHDAESDEDRKNAGEMYQLTCNRINAQGANYADMFRRYQDAQERRNQYIDFYGAIFNNQVEGLVADMKEFGIDNFTLSTGCSGAIETAWLFQQAGCVIEGMVEINGICKEFMSDEYQKAHAFLFNVM